MSFRLLRLTCVVSAGFLVIGCASKPPLWQLNGRSQLELDKQHFYCKDYAANNVLQNPAAYSNLGFGIGSGNPFMAVGSLMQLTGTAAGETLIYEACMNEGGFYKTTQSIPMHLRQRGNAAAGDACFSEFDCATGLSCRSKSGGGNECRMSAP